MSSIFQVDPQRFGQDMRRTSAGSHVYRLVRGMEIVDYIWSSNKITDFEHDLVVFGRVFISVS